MLQSQPTAAELLWQVAVLVKISRQLSVFESWTNYAHRHLTGLTVLAVIY